MVTQNEKKSDVFEAFKQHFSNKTVLLWGEPMVGKTTFSLLLAKKFTKTILIKTDLNYDVSDVKSVAGFEIIIREILDIDELFSVMKQLRNMSISGYLIILDSISTLYDRIMEKYRDNRPLAMNKYRDLVGYCVTVLSEMKKKGNTIVIIAHSRTDWKSGEVEARVPKFLLKNIDAEVKMYTTDKGRKLEVVNVRNFKNIKEDVYEFEI